MGGGRLHTRLAGPTYRARNQFEHPLKEWFEWWEPHFAVCEGATMSQINVRQSVQGHRVALLVGGIAAIPLIVAAFLTPHTFFPAFFPAYLTAYIFCLGIALGSLAVAMIHMLVGGAWGTAIRPLLRASHQTIPLLALLFVPLLFGLRYLYPWANPIEISADPILHGRTGAMNPPGYIFRALVYFCIWILLARAYRRPPENSSGGRATMQYRLAGPGLILYVFSVSFAALDWLMSLEPRWYSTIFGLLVISEEGLTALAFTVGLACLRNAEIGPDSMPPEHEAWNDLAGLLLAFVLIWVYITYSQFNIIWSGDLPSENVFFLHRRVEGWRWFGWADVMLHFALPFTVLLVRGRRNPIPLLRVVTVVLLIAHYLFAYWLVMPRFHATSILPNWQDIVAPIALGGSWLGYLLYNLASPGYPEQAELSKTELKNRMNG